MSEKKNNKSRGVEVAPSTHKNVVKICYERRRKKKDKGSSSTQLPSLSGSGIVEATVEEISELLFVVRKKDKMADNDGSKEGSSVRLSQERGNKNKRKLADPPQQNPISLPLSLTEFPRYEAGSQSNENAIGEHESAEWDDPLVRAFEDLLSSGLHRLFKDAINKIVDCGYSEDDAEKFIFRQGIYCRGEDLVSNIVNGTLDTLKKGKKGIDASSEEVFEDVQQMVDFTMLEMVNVLRQIKPSLSIAEAMWWLLMCDLNMSQAGTTEGELSSFIDCKKVLESTLSKSDSEPHFSRPSTSNTQSSETETLKFGTFPNSPKSTSPTLEKLPGRKDSLNPKETNVGKSVNSLQERMQGMSLADALEVRSGNGRKGRGKKGSVAFRQKSLHGHTEKSYKTYGKGSLKSGQLATIGSFVVEQRVKPLSELPVAQIKGESTKISIEPGVAASAAGISHSVSDSSSTLPAPDSEVIVSSSSEKILAPKPVASIPMSPKLPDYYTGIPFDESLGKYVPGNSKDDLILKLVPRVQELQNEVNSWTEWANQKVMQATRKLSKDLPELKALRKEKQEAEQCKKEKQILEENSMKRLSEMESALDNATGQVKKSNSSIGRLDVERSILKKQMEAAKLEAAKSAVDCQEGLEREQKAVKTTQSISRERELLQEELEANKQKTSQLQEEIIKATNLYNQMEARLNWERREKEKHLAEAAAIKKEREQLEVAAKAEEDKIIGRAENEKKLYLVNINKIESQLALLKHRADAAKIAALRRSIDGGFGNFRAGSSGSGETEVRQERECVMCLEEEKSVVFLPCAHQVLCPKCNEEHEKQGMNECPSCRTPIQRRFNVIFPPGSRP